MRIGQLFWRSPGESGEGGDLAAVNQAIAAGSTTPATPPAPEPGQATPEGDQPAVPYPRFHEQNRKLAETMAENAALREQLNMGAKPEAQPAPSNAPAGLDPKVIESAVAKVLKESGLNNMVDFAMQSRVQQRRQEIVAELKTIPGFDEARDMPRIGEKMQSSGIPNAIDAFKALAFEGGLGLPNRAPLPSDVPRGGQPTGAFDQPQSPNLNNPNLTKHQREKVVQSKYAQMLATDPAWRKALELP